MFEELFQPVAIPAIALLVMAFVLIVIGFMIGSMVITRTYIKMGALNWAAVEERRHKALHQQSAPQFGRMTRQRRDEMHRKK